MPQRAAAAGLRALTLALAPALALAMALVCAFPPWAHAATGQRQAAIAHAQFQARDQLLQDIGWRLAAGNAPFCAARRSVGLQLQDMASYGDPARVRQALGLDGDFAIQTVASGSPAALAGLEPNAEVVAIDGERLASGTAAERLDWKRIAGIHSAIDAALAATGSFVLTMKGGERITLAGVAACPTRFELANGGTRALADGTRVQIGREFPGFTYPQEELAAAIAHELAHNLLGHRTWLDGNGRNMASVRLTEREADRLMPWLLANAGYDPQAALRFMQRWGPRHSGGIFRKRTHDGWDERAELIAAEIALVHPLLEQGGIADWRQYFQREVAPQ